MIININIALRAYYFFKTFLRSVGAQALRGVIIINDPLIIINTREAQNLFYRHFTLKAFFFNTTLPRPAFKPFAALATFA